jgi:hypothetical protein
VAYRPFFGYGRQAGSKITAVARQQILNKQQLNYSSRQLLQKVFYTRSVKSGYTERTPAEAESNASNIALRFVGGDEKGTQCLGVKLGHLVRGGYK